jgi:hypothetical protein
MTRRFESGSLAGDDVGGVAVGTVGMLEEGMPAAPVAKVTIYHNPN